LIRCPICFWSSCTKNSSQFSTGESWRLCLLWFNLYKCQQPESDQVEIWSLSTCMRDLVENLSWISRLLMPGFGNKFWSVFT
jgi:hypothetical protein